MAGKKRVTVPKFQEPVTSKKVQVKVKIPAPVSQEVLDRTWEVAKGMVNGDESRLQRNEDGTVTIL